MLTDRLLRTVLLLHIFGVIVQAALAGQFLSGADSSVQIHEIIGWTVVTLGFVQILLAIVSKSSPLWFVIASVGTFLGEGLQVGTGYGRFLNVHIPLSVLIFGLIVWQATWLFRERTA